MHEMSIAMQLIDQVKLNAEKSRMTRIDRVELEVGAMLMIVPEALDMAFQVLARDTIVEGAELMQTEIPLEAECRACGKVFEANVENFACPACGKADVRFKEGRDIILKSITGETLKEGAEP